MQREQKQGRHAAEQRVRVQQVEERPGPLVVRVDRNAAQDVRERDAPQQRRQRAAPEDRAVPPRLPLRPLVFPAELESHATEDQRRQDQEQREVEAAEQRCVPLGKGGERGAAGHQQPDLVPVPDGPDRVHEDAPVGVVASEERQQNADTEVESFQEEVTDPQHRYQREPEGLEVQVSLVHFRHPLSRRAPARAPELRSPAAPSARTWSTGIRRRPTATRRST